VLVACTGHAIALGPFPVLSGDHRVGAAGAPHRFVANEVANGLTVPWTGIEVARLRMLPSACQRAINLAATFGPDDAVAAGILDEVVRPGDVTLVSRQRAVELGALHQGAHWATKLRMRASALDVLRSALAADVAAIRQRLRL
jgi:enoyl-CoA hydratase